MSSNSGCLRYCKSTIFQANHNPTVKANLGGRVVCDTAKVRFFKQITTMPDGISSALALFAILQKYDFSSKSQQTLVEFEVIECCLRYCKSTIFQANHNYSLSMPFAFHVVCDTAKVRFFKQITTKFQKFLFRLELFAILQKYDFSSKSQLISTSLFIRLCCLRYCKSTIFQANHNYFGVTKISDMVVCDTAKVRFFKQITTDMSEDGMPKSCLRYCKSTIFQANHNYKARNEVTQRLFAILQKYDFSSKSQLHCCLSFLLTVVCDTAKVRFFKQITTQTSGSARSSGCLRYCKSTIFQANHNID